jgi:glutathionyl-hydroquinone reductase
MDEQEIFQKLSRKLDDNFKGFVQEWLALDPSSLIEKAEEIAASKLVYTELKSGIYSAEFLEYLLRLENPLEVVRDQWIDEQNVAHDEEMSHALWTISDKGDAEQLYELDASFIKPDGDGGVKMC